MTGLGRAVHAETLKLLTHPGVWVGAVLTVLFPVLLSAINAAVVRGALESGDTGRLVSTDTTDIGLVDLVMGSAGVIVLGVLVVSSEYARSGTSTGRTRQLSTTMVAVPRRGTAMAAKLLVLAGAVVALATFTVPVSVWLARNALGPWAPPADDLPTKGLGALLYWLVMAALAFALAAVTRSGVVSLVLLLTNATAVSVSFLLSLITPWAKYLPDLAASSTFVTESTVAERLSPTAGAWVAVAWTVAAAVVAVATYQRRDA